MFSHFKGWLERRLALRRLWQQDAKTLIDREERTAYYAAQRLAARSRAIGDGAGFFHWTKVAAEVARTSSAAEMDISVVDAIVAEELEKSRQ